jgi:polygalacturonase
MNVLIATCLILSFYSCVCVVIDFEGAGAIPDDASSSTAWGNGRLLNNTFAMLQPGDTFTVPNKTYHLMGGIISHGLTSVTIQIDGTLFFSDDINAWPKSGGRVLECLQFNDPVNVTFTSARKGTLNGNGYAWWGFPLIGYLIRGENRPRLLHLRNSKNILIENLLLKNSPYWTFLSDDGDGLEIRFTDIDARRLSSKMDDGHNLIDMTTAFNTDGFDVTGNNVWIHDCNIWNQDDSIAVKDGSTNMLFERINASGVGLTIGSIGNSVVRNITFRDCYMHHTFKGIYMKFRADTGGLIADVLYENIVMDTPEQWPIWIGPAQQSDSNDLCAAHPCSLCWPIVPGAQCTPSLSTYRNVTLRNITIINPKQSPGLILANTSNPMTDIVFEDVIVKNPGSFPLGEKYYLCDGVGTGVARGKTWPVPPCFKDETV